MPRLTWDLAGGRFFEIGVDRGVLYPDSQPGVAWTGLMSVVERPSGGSARAFYIDGIKYLNIPSTEEFEATINAFTYPNEFAVCDGTAQFHLGLSVTQQSRKSFGLSYRTKLGNDTDGIDHAYRIHLVYNALAEPSQRVNTTLGGSEEPADFSWDITTRPPTMTGYKRTAHLVVDSRTTNLETMTAIEDILYGTDSLAARLPTLAELVAIFEANTSLTVTDNGDGTFTITGPDEAITMLDATTFEITWPSAIYIDAVSYTISSL